MVILFTILALLAPPTPALDSSAFFMSGAKLKEACGTDDDLNLGLCVGYIDSVLDAQIFRDSYIKPAKICISTAVTNADLRGAVLRELNKEDDGLRLPAFTYVQRAVGTGWACPPAATGR